MCARCIARCQSVRSDARVCLCHRVQAWKERVVLDLSVENDRLQQENAMLRGALASAARGNSRGARAALDGLREAERAAAGRGGAAGGGGGGVGSNATGVRNLAVLPTLGSVMFDSPLKCVSLTTAPWFT